MKKIAFTKRVNWNTMFHVVITLKNGFHKTLVVTRRIVATIVTRYNECKQDIFGRTYDLNVCGQDIVLNDCKEIRIVYENTKAEFLTLS